MQEVQPWVHRELVAVYEQVKIMWDTSILTKFLESNHIDIPIVHKSSPEWILSDIVG